MKKIVGVIYDDGSVSEPVNIQPKESFKKAHGAYHVWAYQNQFDSHDNEILQCLNDDEEGFKEDFKKFVKDTREDEVADILIRVLDLCGAMNIDIDFHVQAKLRYNSLRPHKHGKTY